MYLNLQSRNLSGSKGFYVFKLGILLLLSCFFAFVFFVNPGFAQVPTVGQLGLEYGTAAGLGTQDIRLTVARIIRAFLGLLGTVALVLIIYGGFLYMTAAGEEEKITRAKQLLINAGIGLAIILSAFAITQFVISRLIAATLGLVGVGPAGGVQTISPLSNALGGGIIREHYPGRDQTGIPRNIKVIITFKEPIDPASLVKNYNNNETPENLDDDQVLLNNNGTSEVVDDYMELNTDALKIYPSESAVNFLSSGDIRVNFTPDLKTWVFDPVPLLGSPSEEVWYTVELAGGAAGARLLNGQAAFAGVFGSGYTWEFQVSTFVDTTPPRVVSLIPLQEIDCGAGGGPPGCARNIIITINFNEPIDPTTVSGHTLEFTNLLVDEQPDLPGGNVAGAFAISNQYRTVEFTPDLSCGVNSCGQDIFCLPGPSQIMVTAKAAALSAEPPQAAFPYPYNGVTDVVGNSLDGESATGPTGGICSGDGTAEGPDTDNCSWIFNTSSIIDTTPPSIINVSPSLNAENVNANLPLTSIFSERMRLSTLSSENIHLQGANAAGGYSFDPAIVPWYGFWNSNIWWTSGQDIVTGAPAPTGNYATTKSELRHGTFVVDTSYYPGVGSGVQDLYQNCLFPPNAGAEAGPGLQCATTLAEPYCCVGSTGPVACASPCEISTSGNPVCP